MSVYRQNERSCTTPAVLGLMSHLHCQLCSCSQCYAVDWPSSYRTQPLFANAAYRAACNIDWVKQQQGSVKMSTIDFATRHLQTTKEQAPITLQYSAAVKITKQTTLDYVEASSCTKLTSLCLPSCERELLKTKGWSRTGTLLMCSCCNTLQQHCAEQHVMPCLSHCIRSYKMVMIMNANCSR